MKKNILVVDDEQDLCDIMKFNLAAEGYNVDSCNSGEEALRIVTADPTHYNLLLLDVMMGGISGFETASELKKNNLTAHIPIIFITAKDSESHTITGLNLGADDYIPKPFSIREVIARVAAVLRRSSTVVRAPQLITHETLTLDLTTKSLFIDGESVTLTPTEYNILLILITEQGQLFSRQQLISRAWPDHVVVTDRTVDVNITRLRRKLGPYATCIVTRLGFGYCFQA